MFPLLVLFCASDTTPRATLTFGNGGAPPKCAEGCFPPWPGVLREPRPSGDGVRGCHIPPGPQAPSPSLCSRPPSGVRIVSDSAPCAVLHGVTAVQAPAACFGESFLRLSCPGTPGNTTAGVHPHSAGAPLASGASQLGPLPASHQPIARAQ